MTRMKDSVTFYEASRLIISEGNLREQNNKIRHLVVAIDIVKKIILNQE
jgi:hypothetical protein